MARLVVMEHFKHIRVAERPQLNSTQRRLERRERRVLDAVRVGQDQVTLVQANALRAREHIAQSTTKSNVYMSRLFDISRQVGVRRRLSEMGIQGAVLLSRSDRCLREWLAFVRGHSQERSRRV